MATFKLYLRKSFKKKDGQIPIYIVAYNEGKQRYIQLPAFCKLNEWDKKGNVPKNFQLMKFCQEKLMAVQNEFYKSGFNVAKFKQVIKTDSESFLECARSEIEKERKVSRRNGIAYNTAVNNFVEFWGRGDIPFNSVTSEVIRDYKRWCKVKGLSLNSQSVYLRTLRAIWKRSTQTENPFLGLVPKTTRTIKRSLTRQQMIEIRDSEGWARDVFMLMFYLCGLNYLDLFNAKREQIKGDWFYFKRTKLRERADELKIWMCREARELLEQYIETFTGNYDNSLKRINYALKDYVDGLTTYYARHTFATIAVENGVDYNLVKTLVGHTDTSTLGIYIKYTDEVIKGAIERAVVL